nr:reverse transcriptase domain-containing protein [Tanacetum cinerariifolium]
MAPKRRTTRLNPGTTPVTTPSTTTTSVTNAQLQAMIDKGVNDALAARNATRNGDDSHTSGTGARMLVQAARECSYSEFLKCKPLDFKGTEGVVGLTRWFEKMKSVFSISNYTASNQVKFATCTLQDDAHTWWNSHVKTTTPEAAHAMTVDPLNPLTPASESEPKDVTEAGNPMEHEDETVPASVHEIGKSSTAPFLREDSDGLLHGLMRRDINSLFGRMDSLSRRLFGHETVHALVEKKRKAKAKYYGKLILDLGNEVRSSMEQRMATMEKLVEKHSNAEDNVDCKRLKKELEQARFSNTFLHMQNQRVERDLYWTRVQAHESHQEMICKGFVFEERTNEAINVLIEDEKSPSSEPRGSPHDA